MGRKTHQTRHILKLLAAFCALAAAVDVRAGIGWDLDDFIITGAPNFPDRIGIFDQDFTFKGYLDQNFFGVQGMDFDAQGRLVAESSLNPEVRIYDPSGAKVGGFTQAMSPLLVPAGDLKVAPDGNYALGTSANGVRLFTPQGIFVRQYGNGDSRGITYVPGNRLWSGGAGTSVHIFDALSGLETGTFSANEQTISYSMQYSSTTNTVLIVDYDRDAGGIFERDLTGNLLRQFHVPVAQTATNGVTRGPDSHVFGTTDDFFVDLVDWRPDGSVARTINVYPVQITPVRILWAGIVPEPTAPLTILCIGLSASLRLRRTGS